MANEVRCGSIKRALDPARPDGVQIDVHFLVIPAMARNKQPDPVLLLAGGPGQSAITLAPAVMSRFSRLNNQRDLVFIDQRGTGKSAPLHCPDESKLPIAQALDTTAQLRRLQLCRDELARLPYGDMRFFTTTLAMQDVDAVRQHLGAPRWNLVGASYGTRAALDYLRQFPEKVRRAVLDGVAPADMALPASFSTDGQAALNAVFFACERQPDCLKRYPMLHQKWTALLRSVPREIHVAHPVTGLPEHFTLTRDLVLRAVRSALYSPSLASALPAALSAASEGRFESLIGLSRVLGSTKATRLAMGQHFSVICAEDIPRLSGSQDIAGADFGAMDATLYQQICADWPRGEVPADFYNIPITRSPVLLLSGGADPATPARHGARVAKALGAMAQHVIVPEAGHGVMGLGCMADLIHRFVTATDDTKALPQDAACATRIPRPGAFVPVQSSELELAK